MIPTGVYLFIVNNGNTRTVCEIYPTVIYLFIVNNGNTRTVCEIYPIVAMETLEQSVKSIQRKQKRPRNDFTDVFLVSLLLTLNRFHTLFFYFHSWLGTNKHRVDIVLRLLKVYIKNIRKIISGKSFVKWTEIIWKRESCVNPL